MWLVGACVDGSRLVTRLLVVASLDKGWFLCSGEEEMINVTEQDMLTFFCSTPHLPRRPVNNPMPDEGFPSDYRQMFSLTESL